MDDFIDALLGDRVEADDAVVESLADLEALGAFHVHTVDRVVVRLEVFVRLVVWGYLLLSVPELPSRGEVPRSDFESDSPKKKKHEGSPSGVRVPAHVVPFFVRGCCQPFQPLVPSDVSCLELGWWSCILPKSMHLVTICLVLEDLGCLFRHFDVLDHVLRAGCQLRNS